MRLASLEFETKTHTTKSYNKQTIKYCQLHSHSQIHTYHNTRYSKKDGSIQQRDLNYSTVTVYCRVFATFPFWEGSLTFLGKQVSFFKFQFRNMNVCLTSPKLFVMCALQAKFLEITSWCR